MAQTKDPTSCGGSGGVRVTDQLDGPVAPTNNRSQKPLQVVVTPTGRKWRAMFSGRMLCVSTSPFIASARILIVQGFDPNCIIEMWHGGAAEWALRGRLGAVAATLIDGETAARCAKNGSPVRFSGTTLAGAAP
jgi:hypothetical protein